MYKPWSRDLMLLCALFSCACGRLGVELVNVDGSSNVDGGAGDGAPHLAMRSCRLDTDGDGTVDCEDDCHEDPRKVVPGVCGCTVADADGDGDGILDCMDSCGGSNDANYVSSASCGVGHCRTNNTPSSCVAGKETLCQPGTPRAATDTTCDGVDDDCDGQVDEDYVPVTGCGVGSCAARSTPSSCASGVVTACRPASPLSSNDPTKDNVDDDCDGTVDEDACIAHTELFGLGASTGAAGTCTHITVKLWGGAGASGDAQGGYWGVTTNGGMGGAGGFAQQTFTVNASSNIRIYVGQGGQGCGAPGTNSLANNGGGNGATTLGANGTRGSDGTVTGGAGANPSPGGQGGAGSFGGGGGGAGSGPGYAPFGGGGGGGAASVVIVDSARLVAGGGGGGGGAGTNVATAGFSGGNGGPGCGGPGASATSEGGGGGGGGVCQGAAVTQRGMGRTPYNAANDLPAGLATGGNNNVDCQPGGNGYAIVTYNP
jgi:hypothetical protein